MAIKLIDSRYKRLVQEVDDVDRDASERKFQCCTFEYFSFPEEFLKIQVHFDLFTPCTPMQAFCEYIVKKKFILKRENKSIMKSMLMLDLEKLVINFFLYD